MFGKRGLLVPARDNARHRSRSLFDLLTRGGLKPIDAYHARDTETGRVIPIISGAGGATRLFRAHNGAMVTTAAFVPVTTGTAIKTLMQLQPPAGSEMFVVEWGISFDGFAAAAPGKVELIDTQAVAATVTAYVAANDFVSLTDPAALASQLTVGTAASGFTASAEGTITATRMLDSQLIAPTNQYVKQFPLGQEPRIAASKNLRIRVTFGTAINATCYIVWSE